MKLIIVGCDNNKLIKLLEEAIEKHKFNVTEIVCNEMKETCHVREWARAKSIPVTEFRENKERYGKNAVILRDSEMAVYGDFLIAFPTGILKDSRNMVNQMLKRGKPFEVIDI
jgi:hypothetical protein